MLQWDSPLKFESKASDANGSCCFAGTEVCTFMRTNGFIFIALAFTAVGLAGQPGYLPNVGPITLRFEQKPSVQKAKLPPLRQPEPPAAEPLPEKIEPSEVPTPQLPDPGLETNSMMQNPPGPLPGAMAGSQTNATTQLIGPIMDNAGTVTPQMFLRFFTPPQNGVSREAVLVAPPGFNPALPPPPSSSATYTQPEP